MCARETRRGNEHIALAEGVHRALERCRVGTNRSRELLANALFSARHLGGGGVAPPERREHTLVRIELAKEIGRRLAHDANARGQGARKIRAHHDELGKRDLAIERSGDRCSCAPARGIILGLGPPECDASRRERVLKRVSEIESNPPSRPRRA